MPTPGTLAEQGFYIFPTDPMTGRPVIEGQDWGAYSTNDPAEVRRLWDEYPGAGIGIDCGKSGLVVVDLDVKHGNDGIREWERVIGDRAVPETYRTRTRNAGRHLYFRDPQGLYKSTVGKLGPGIDTKAVGGYVVAYPWEAEAPMSLGDIPLAPSGLLPLRAVDTPMSGDPFSAPSRVFTRDQAEAFIHPHLEALRTAPNGKINDTLNSAATVLSHFVNGGFWTQEEATELLLKALSETVYDGRTWSAEATIQSGLSTKSWVAVLATEPRQADPSTWLPLDLTQFRDGLGVPPPEVGKREDHAGMFYRGRVNDIHGESESGKTWIALFHAADDITSGRDVVYFDWEDSGAGITERLVALGCSWDSILSHFRYINPEGGLNDAARDSLAPILSSAWSVYFDATTEALAAFGLSSNSDVEVAEFFRVLPRWAASLGPAAVLIDHVPKAQDNRTGPTGSQHKRSAITGASFLVESVEPFSRGGSGRSRVKVAKDRPGHVRGVAVDGKWFADFTLETRDSGALWPRLQVPLVNAKGPGSDEPREALVASILKVIRTEEAQGTPPAESRIRKMVKGRDGETIRALAWLVEKGRVSMEIGPRKAKLYRVTETEESE